MERVKWVDQKLQEWAAWQYGGGTTRCGGNMFDPNRVSQTADVRAGMRNADPKFNECVLEMDRAICSIPVDLKRVVVANYTWEGGKEVISSKLGITRATLHRRLCNADSRITDWFEVRREMKDKVRSNLNYSVGA